MVVLNRAVDGKLNGRYKGGSCTHTRNTANPWLVIDLQDNYEVTHIKIKNRKDCCGK